MKKKNIIIIIIVFIILVGCSIFISIKSNKTKPAPPKNEIKDSVKKDIEETIKKDETLTEKEKLGLTINEKEGIVVGEKLGETKDALKLGKETNPEYSKIASDSLYKELIKYAQTASYLDITNKVDELKQSYKFTENYNLRIGKVYLDSLIMIKVKDASEKGQRGYMVSKLQDPYMILIGTLLIPERERRLVIKETTSLSPMFKGEIKINSTKIFNEKNLDENMQAKLIFDKEESISELYQISISLEGNPLFGYVAKYGNGNISLITILQDGDYEFPYKPITFWMELDSVIYGD